MSLRTVSSASANMPAHRTISRLRDARILAIFALSLVLLTGCGAAAPETPVIGSPSPGASSQLPTTPGRPGELRARWNLTGIDLPSDWPDVPLPKGTQVASAYAVDSPPRRTWTASFIGEGGTALELAKPIIKQLTKSGYRAVSAYSASADADAGLFGFTGDQYSVYLMLGEVDGRPNLLITVRQQGSNVPSTGAPSVGSPAKGNPSTSPSPVISGTLTSPATGTLETTEPSAPSRSVSPTSARP